MGNSPGLANVSPRWCADTMLDQVEEVNIYHAHGGEPAEGGGVIKHRIHAMTNDIPLFIDGEFIQVRMLEESGRKHVDGDGVPGHRDLPGLPLPPPRDHHHAEVLQGHQERDEHGLRPARWITSS